MFEHKLIQKPDDFFLELSHRREKGVYFYRINAYSEEIGDFLRKYYEVARRNGVIIEGKIPNPDEKNLAYYEEMMGLDFQMNQNFINASLRKWLPRMNDYQRNSVTMAVYDTLERMKKAGKNDNMLKNAYIKFMCWLYYKFERVVNQLGQENIPKILYEGSISNYELKLITILSNAGCDVILLQKNGDSEYLKLDPDSQLSCNLCLEGMQPFPETFSIAWVRKQIEEQLNKERLYGGKPEVMNCTNAWIEGTGLSDFLTGMQARGNAPDLFYNCFVRMNGVEDKITYLNELYQFLLEIKNHKRPLLILEEQIPRPSNEEISAIRRNNYQNKEQLIMDLSGNIRYSANVLLQKIMQKAFTDVLLEEAALPGMNLNKLTNKAVYLLCWLNRYQRDLFSNWKMPEISCFIYLGGCNDENEALFVRFLARLPIDVLILTPNLDKKCCLTDRLLYEIHYENSLAVSKFPKENSEIVMGTAAYHAERELDTVMYQDSGIYRNQQYQKEMSVTLQTMYEEIAILWDQELKYRPNFSVVDGVVNVPVLFAKVSGVKEANVSKYWSDIRGLVTEDTFVIKSAPFIQSTDPNPMKEFATSFFKNGRLNKTKIKEHPQYPYGVLREEMQDHILEKLKLLIEQKIIKGTFENGTEYTIIATVLNLPKEIVRLIQRFDFTKKNPKLIYINTTEKIISLEDSIITAFLNLVGFDIVFYVPTGYQNIEKFFNRKIMEEHQIGEYVYDLQVPNLNRISSSSGRSWRDKIFKRGR